MFCVLCLLLRWVVVFVVEILREVADVLLVVGAAVFADMVDVVAAVDFSLACVALERCAA